MNTCANCEHNDGCVYTSYPPMYKCTITGNFHYGNYECDCLVKGKLNSTNARTANLVDVSKESVEEIADAVAEKMAGSTDTVRIVRCKNCRFFYLDDKESGSGRCRFHRDDAGKMEIVHESFFCAYGLSWKK